MIFCVLGCKVFMELCQFFLYCFIGFCIYYQYLREDIFKYGKDYFKFYMESNEVNLIVNMLVKVDGISVFNLRFVI